MEIEIKKTVKICSEIVLMVAFYYLLNQGGFFKYSVTAALSGILFVLGRKNRFHVEYLCVFLPSVFYILIGSFTALISGNVTFFLFKELVFLLLPPVWALAASIFFQGRLEYFINLQFASSVAVYLLFYYQRLLHLQKAESTFAFVFGLFVLFYAYKGQWRQMVLAFVLLILANKRIATLAVIAGLLCVLIFKISDHKKKITGIAWISSILIAFMYIYSIFSGYMADISLLAGVETNGRLNIYRQICLKSEFSVSYTGSGMGSVLSWLDQLNIAAFSNLHNDLLAFYVELGFVGFFLFLSSYFIYFVLYDSVLDRKGLSQMIVFAIYSLLLYMTDNVFIYILYLVPMYSICFELFKKE